jgi:co-chaperonin GroES (HSP10)
VSWKTPTLADCDSGIEPTEFQVLIAMAVKEAKTSGGILLPEATREKEGWGSTHARLLAVSPLAFSYSDAWPSPLAKPQIGDVVFVGKYPGEEVIGRDGQTYRLCADREIAGIIERADAQAMEQNRAA